MSELASIAEEASSATLNATCPVCSHDAINMKKLKTHILLKHPKQNLCLFCIEKKGWSDTFASQSSYNQHYKTNHEGIIERKEKIKEEDKLWKKQERARVNEIAEKLGKPPPKRLRKRLICNLCSPRVEFDTPDTFERHLIAEHDFDYCQACCLIGPIAQIRIHILEMHSTDNAKNGKYCCYICCGAASIFTELPNLQAHLASKHGLKTASNDENTKVIEFPCYNCDLDRRKQGFPSIVALKEHLQYKHEPSNGEKLKAMRKRSKGGKVVSISTQETHLKRVIGIKNPSGLDCFSISVLHLIAQTDLAQDLISFVKDTKPDCDEHPASLAGKMLTEYLTTRQLLIDADLIVKNYRKFGLSSINGADCGDFLRGFLKTISEDKPHFPNDFLTKCGIWLEWKFECSQCHRFLTVRAKDYVLKLKVPEEKSLNDLLKDFLNSKTCRCGKVNPVSPIVKNIGQYVFLEIDRTIYSGEKLLIKL